MDKDDRERYRFSSVPPLVLLGEDVVLERGTEASEFCRELLEYNVLLKDLIAINIPYSIKNEILNIAFYIIGDVECYDIFKDKKEIPLKLICKEFCKPRAFIERWRDYLIAYVIILGDIKYKHLQDYIMVVEDNTEDKNLQTALSSEDENVKGIILKVIRKKARIITSNGEFLSIKLKEKATVGEEVSGIISKKLKDFKLQLSILAFMSIILIGTFTLKYMKVTSTILVKTTSPIILEVNSFKRVKSIKSNTEKGTAMVNTIKVLDRSLDSSIIEILKYAKENEMLPIGGIIITVSGKPIKHGDLIKTEDYIFIERIDVNINNSGTEYKLN